MPPYLVLIAFVHHQVFRLRRAANINSKRPGLGFLRLRPGSASIQVSAVGHDDQCAFIDEPWPWLRAHRLHLNHYLTTNLGTVRLGKANRAKNFVSLKGGAL